MTKGKDKWVACNEIMIKMHKDIKLNLVNLKYVLSNVQ